MHCNDIKSGIHFNAYSSIQCIVWLFSAHILINKKA